MSGELMKSQDPIPTLECAIEKLDFLVQKKLSRAEVANWAEVWVVRLDEIDDVKLCKAIDWISGVDAPTADRPYLYNEDDFKSWIVELSS